MKILILSHNNVDGAGRAADRLHKTFLSKDLNSHLWINTGTVSTPATIQLSSKTRYFRILLSAVSQKLLKFQNSKIQYSRSLNLFRSSLVEKINHSDFDVVNLHWINGEILSVADIGRIKKPIVMTLHDMWAFCGAEHYAPDVAEARWRTGYSNLNRAAGDTGPDLDRWTWVRKRKHWRKPFHLVSPSNWLADCVRSSALMREWPITVIPNPVDITIYRPWPKDLAREMCGLPAQAKIILFGAIGSDKTGRKGQDIFLDALAHFRSNGTLGCHLAIFGQNKPLKEPSFGFSIQWMGRKHDDISMALLYSASDVMVVPSRMDNLPQTATEAQSCGCPVVAFRACGLPDTLEDRETGYLAEPFDPNDLARGLEFVINNEHFCDQRRLHIAKRANHAWNSRSITTAYSDVFKMAKI